MFLKQLKAMTNSCLFSLISKDFIYSQLLIATGRELYQQKHNTSRLFLPEVQGVCLLNQGKI